MSVIDQNIAAYDAVKSELEARYTGKWVLFYDCKLVDTFDSSEEAAEEAVKRFAAGPYLIRQIGAPPIVLPASVMFNLQRIPSPKP